MSKFLERTIERAKADRKTIVLAEGEDIRSIQAASMIVEKDICDIVLLGDAEKIAQTAGDISLDGVTIIDPKKSEKLDEFANTFYEMRKAKGMTPEKAKETMLNPLYYGVMMVESNAADGMVAGAVNSTSNVLRPALQILKTAPGTKLVSAFFVMVVPDCEYGEKGTFIYSDAGLNENPDADAVSEIAISSAASFKNLVEAEPKVAMLSYSTYGSAKSELVDKMQLATKLAKEKRPDIQLDGELQVDAAIVPAIGQSKAPGSKTAGHANVLVFPDLNAGNIGYKLVARLGGYTAIGPIMINFNKPVNDLSRGCTVQEIVDTVCITKLQIE